MARGGDAADARFMFWAEIHTRGGVPGKKIMVGATAAKGYDAERGLNVKCRREVVIFNDSRHVMGRAKGNIGGKPKQRILQRHRMPQRQADYCNVKGNQDAFGAQVGQAYYALRVGVCRGS